jgi:hypothetical protein
MHVERHKNADEELSFRPPLLVGDLAAAAKLVIQLLPTKVSLIPALKYTTDPLKTPTVALFWP